MNWNLFFSGMYFVFLSIFPKWTLRYSDLKNELDEEKKEKAEIYRKLIDREQENNMLKVELTAYEKRKSEARLVNAELDFLNMHPNEEAF